MTKTRRAGAVAAVVVALLCTMPARGRAAEPFQLQASDHICHHRQHAGRADAVRRLAGDDAARAFSEARAGHPQSRLQRRRDHDAAALEELRHAGRVAQRDRAAPIGGYQENRLAGTNTKADVIFAFFGYNESYAGQEGLRAFKQQLGDWIEHTLAQKYNGKSAPRIVLFSPIAHEDLRNPDLPDGRENNAAAGALHARRWRRWRRRTSVTFVDLFTPSRAAVCVGEDAADDQRRAPEHRGQPADRRGHRPRAVRRGAGAEQAAYLTTLRQAVLDKNFHWFNRYRDDRRLRDLRRPRVPDLHPRQPAQREPEETCKFAKEDVLPTNYEVLQREVSVLDVMTGNRDRRIWAVARGIAIPSQRISRLWTPTRRRSSTRRPTSPARGRTARTSSFDGDEAIQQMTIGKGLKVELFASEKRIPRAGQPGADGLRHEGPAVGRVPGRTTRTGSRRRRWTTSC